MKRYFLLLLLLVALAGAGIGFFALRPVRPAMVPPAPPQPALALETVRSARLSDVDSLARSPGRMDEPSHDAAASPLLAAEDEAQRHVRRLMATLDEAYVPEIARYLDHPARTVRDAARDALILIGDSSAAPYLSLAAEKGERTPGLESEAATLREAAKLLADARRMEGQRLPKTALDAGPTRSEEDIPSRQTGSL